MSRLRVLLTTDAVGGVWTYSLDLARALAAQADAVVILAVLGPNPSPDQLTRAAAVPGLQLVQTGLPLDWTADAPQELRAAAAALAELAAAAEAAIVQLHAPALALADYPAPVVSVVHSCLATWWAAVKTGALPDDFAWRSALTAEGLDRSDLAVAPSAAFADAVRRAYGPNQAPAAVPNGRSLPSLPAPGEPADFVLTSGRLWDEGKAIAAFDAAAARASLPFRAAGPMEGPNGASVRLAHAEALGTLDGDALAALLARRPIFVSAARYEPFGLSVLEAAQAGCALILSPIPTFRELWDGAALFADTPGEIAAAADRLAADPKARARLGEAARQRADRFTPEAMGSAMLAHYRALQRPARRAAA